MQVYANPASCNSFYKCENGTATGEECENGLLFDPLLALTDAVHNYCVYTWRAECGARPADRRPEPSPGAEPVTEWWRCRMVAEWWSAGWWLSAPPPPLCFRMGGSKDIFIYNDFELLLDNFGPNGPE